MKKSAPAKVYLHRYQAEKPLGEGGMGQVFLGRNLDDNSQVVIKVMRPEFARVPEVRHSFMQEMRLMTRFRHAHAVNLIEGSVGDDEPCIVMEYVPGLTLDDLLERRQRLNPVRTGKILGQLCQVLDAAHALGILHRDLTPANLMVMNADTPNESIKVMDFGLSRMGTGHHIAFEKLLGHVDSIGGGTPDYVCPEQIRGEVVDQRGDVYSVGIMLYRMLSGRVPFADISDTQAILQAHLDREPPRFGYIGVGDIPWELEAIVRSCLAKQPGDRPQSARELAERYEKVIGLRIFEPNPVLQNTAESDGDAESSEKEGKSGNDIDPDHVIMRFEAWMPESIAVYKLRGFIDSMGGEVMESVPGLIRLRLPERRTRPQPEPSPLLSLIGLARKPAAPAQHIIELHMSNRVIERKNLLEVTVAMQPEDGRNLGRKHFAEKASRELRAFLMGR